MFVNENPERKKKDKKKKNRKKKKWGSKTRISTLKVKKKIKNNVKTAKNNTPNKRKVTM